MGVGLPFLLIELKYQRVIFESFWFLWITSVSLPSCEAGHKACHPREEAAETKQPTQNSNSALQYCGISLIGSYVCMLTPTSDVWVVGS